MDNESQQIVRRIGTDLTHGASELALMALDGLHRYAETWHGDSIDSFFEDLQHLIDELKSVRPSMVAIENLIRGFEHQVQLVNTGSLTDGRESVARVALQLKEDAERASKTAALKAAELVEENDVLMTHSLGSMVKRVFRLVSDRSVKAIVTESRPGNEGKLLAEFLSALEIETSYITDAQMGLWVPMADKIIIGSDCVLRDGGVVNKSGTLLLALAAREHEVPVYVCCESFKWTDAGSHQHELEEMDPKELGLPRLDHVVARNIYFDVTPAELVTAWVSELGVEYEWL